MRRKGFLIAMVLGAGLVWCPDSADAARRLRFQPREGDVQRYEMANRQIAHMDMGPLGQQSVETLQRMEMSQTVVEVRRDGSSLLELRYDDFTMEIDTGEGAMGEAMGESGLGDLQQLLVGRTFQMELDAQGEVLRVSGFEKLLDELVGSRDGAPPGMEKLTEMLRGSLSDDAMKAMMQQAMPIFPQESLVPGIRWAKDFELSNPMIGEITSHIEYQLAGYERRERRKCARLEFETATAMPETIPLFEQMQEVFSAQDIDMKMEISVGDVSGAGTIWTDVRSGVLVESVANQTMEVRMKMTFPPPPGDEADVAADEPRSVEMQIALDQEIRMQEIP